MRIAVRREPDPGERRVAGTPESVRQLVGAGLEVTVEAGAGIAAGYPDADYAAAGATVSKKLDLAKTDVLAHVRPLGPDVIAALRTGAMTVGLASPASELADGRRAARPRVTAFAIELVPRISRAQSMDALTSQALVAGYRCVLEAAMRLPRFFPLFMTAAGTVPPAKVLVLGAGVAGLQAIATAKRLGAMVSAYDVRRGIRRRGRARWAARSSTSTSTPRMPAAATPRSSRADRAKRQQELLTPHVADVRCDHHDRGDPRPPRAATGHRRRC